jgi:glycerol-3-phosphate cytidylyltransferase
MRNMTYKNTHKLLYMAVQIAINDLSAFRNTNIDKKIGVTFSCWDLLHAGHQLFLCDSKNNCDILCVGLQTDPTIDRPEKNKPIQSLEEREIQLKSSRYVDYYFIYDTEQSLYNSLVALQPNVRFLGDDYVGKKFTGSDLSLDIFFHSRSMHTYSTTNLRNLIYKREVSKRKLGVKT